MPDLLPYLVVIEPIGEPVRYRVRLYGTAMVALRGADLTGRWLDEPGALPAPLYRSFLQTYEAAIARREPQTHVVRYNRPGSDSVEWSHNRVVLPFSRGGADAVGTLVAAVFPLGGEPPG